MSIIRRLVLLILLGGIVPGSLCLAQSRVAEALEPVDAQLMPASDDPAPERLLPQMEPVAPASSDAAEAVPPAPLDPDVIPAQGASAGSRPGLAAPGAANVAVPFAGDPATLRQGKQAVGVSVQVVAPPAMTMHKPATVTIVVKNDGTTDALGVVVRDQLPDGAKFVRGVPEPSQISAADHGGFIMWNLGTLSAGSEKKLTVTVEPVAKGPQDHAAFVTLAAGSRAKSVVLQPLLHVEQTVNKTTVLKGQQVRFDITVTNDGDGPARDVVVRAELSGGLRHEQQGSVLELSLAEQGATVLAANKPFKLPPLYVDAVSGGEHTCTVRVSSPDVVGDSPTAQSVATVTITEPVMKLSLAGSTKRPTDTPAEYTITVANEGTAPAQDVRVSAALVGDFRRYQVEGATWDAANRRWVWTIPLLEPNGKTHTFPFRVRLGGVGVFQVNAEAVANGGLKEVKSLSTSVEGMADLDMEVSEDLRVLDVGQVTAFRVKLRNLGSKEATGIQVSALMSKNLEVIETAGTDEKAGLGQDTNTVVFPPIERLGPGSELELGIKARGRVPGLASCRVRVSHKDLGTGDALEDVANATITEAAAR